MGVPNGFGHRIFDFLLSLRKDDSLTLLARCRVCSGIRGSLGLLVKFQKGTLGWWRDYYCWNQGSLAMYQS